MFDDTTEEPMGADTAKMIITAFVLCMVCWAKKC